jgi:NAD(P)-dependent dehydrogenase (short-subunit alcohol dehydrogenase family)
MHIDLTGKTAIISGSTAGIGLATAIGLAHTGCAVVINGRAQAAVDAAVGTVGRWDSVCRAPWFGDGGGPEFGRGRQPAN